MGKYYCGFAKKYPVKVSTCFKVKHLNWMNCLCEDGYFVQITGTANDILKVVKDLKSVGYIVDTENNYAPTLLRSNMMYGICFPVNIVDDEGDDWKFEPEYHGLYEVFEMQ